MKLLRYGPKGAELPGILDGSGRMRDLSGVTGDFSGKTLNRASLEKLKTLDLESLPLAPEGSRIGPCVGRVGNFVAVGLNFADHAKESNIPTPSEPILFNKAPSCICGPHDDVILPRGSSKVDWEVELAVVIGDDCLYVSEAEAMNCVAGFCICNDVSERVFQMERGGNWCKGKSCPTFGPLGPWLVTPDEFTRPDKRAMWLDVNGERMQTGNTATMIFNVLFLVSYVSQFMLLEPGDVITTGTPPGVGMGKVPPRYLKAGDVMELGVDGLGRQRQRVVPASV